MRQFILALIAALAMTGVNSAYAENWTIAPPGTSRSKEIKTMEILERPNRVLHVYGDAVRLANRRHTNGARF